MEEALPFENKMLLLAGQPRIQDFVQMVLTRAVDGHKADQHELTRIWREAHAHIQRMETDTIDWRAVSTPSPLPEALRDSGEKLLRDPTIQRSFGFLPHTWSMVPLDWLIPLQRYVNLTYVETVRQRWPRQLSPSAILDVAVGSNHSPPDIHVAPLSRNQYSFSSVSNDIRVLGATPLNPADVRGYQPFGRPATVLAIYIGYSVNCMVAAYMDNRLLLINGTHRAYSLRSAGVTHAPCLVVEARNKEELDLIEARGPHGDSLWYFTARRPPLLQDFFNEALHKTFWFRRSIHEVRLDMKFDRARLPAQ